MPKRYKTAAGSEMMGNVVGLRTSRQLYNGFKRSVARIDLEWSEAA